MQLPFLLPSPAVVTFFDWSLLGHFCSVGNPIGMGEKHQGTCIIDHLKERDAYSKIQTAIIFGVAGVFYLNMFFAVSWMMHRLVSLQHDSESQMISLLVRIHA